MKGTKKSTKSYVRNCVRKLMRSKTLVAAFALMVPTIAGTCVIWILGAEEVPECMIEE